MYLECPNCYETVEVDPDCCEGARKNLEEECPQCRIQIVYDVEFEPQICDVREMPPCCFINHDFSSPKDCGHYYERVCIHCGESKNEYKPGV